MTEQTQKTDINHQGKYYLEVYGCQMNVADSDLVSGILDEAGWTRTEEPGEADAILMVTCAVRDRAVQRVLGRSTDLCRHRAQKPTLVMGMLGCVAQYLADNQETSLNYLDLIVGPDEYRNLPRLLDDRRRTRSGEAGPEVLAEQNHGETYENLSVPRTGSSSAFITVQRGCNRFCAYCVVPLVRGRERAVSPDWVVQQVADLVASGCSEVTLLGQSVSAYRHGETGFAQLLRKVGSIPGLLRLRFTSPHPAYFKDDLIEAIAQEDKVCPHLHLPVQSGSDRILTAMGRGHGSDEYRTLLDRLRQAVPGLSLTTDFMVGFPGETEEDFQQTMELCRYGRFDTAFMFAYSPRKGTRACDTMCDDVDGAQKQRRLAELISLQESISGELMAKDVGRIVEVMVEGRAKRSPSLLTGRSATFRKVVFSPPPGQEEEQGSDGGGAPLSAGSPLRAGRLVRVLIEKSNAHTLTGEMVNSRDN